MRAALRPLSILRGCATAASASSARRLASRRRRMGGEKQRDAADAVVEIGAERHELDDLGISEPVEPDPGRDRTLADGVSRELCGDLVGFGQEGLLVGRDCRAGAQDADRLWSNRGRALGPRDRRGVLPDDLDLPGDLPLVEVARHGRAHERGPALPRSKSRRRRHRECRCRRSATRSAGRSAPAAPRVRRAAAARADRQPGPSPPAWPGSPPAPTRSRHRPCVR